MFVFQLIIFFILCACHQAERSTYDGNILSIPVPMRRGGSESNLDVVDSVGEGGVGLDFTKGALGIDSLQQKILKVRGNRKCTSSEEPFRFIVLTEPFVHV